MLKMLASMNKISASSSLLKSLITLTILSKTQPNKSYCSVLVYKVIQSYEKLEPNFCMHITFPYNVTASFNHSNTTPLQQAQKKNSKCPRYKA
jgi:hypothetical protein